MPPCPVELAPLDMLYFVKQCQEEFQFKLTGVVLDGSQAKFMCKFASIATAMV